MNFNPSWFVFFFLSLLGLVIITGSNNWFMAWIGFELSLLGFIPLFSINSIVIEGLMKYFLVQSAGSGLFLLSFMSSNTGTYLMISSLFLNLGLFPFFSWIPVVMVCLSWTGCLILNTVQNLGPFFLLASAFNLSSYFWFIVLAGSVSVLIGGVLGLNQTNLRSLMAYSSISHSGWMVSVVSLSFNLFLIYFFIYSSLILFMFISFEMYNYHNVVDLKAGGPESLKISLLFLSLAGIPPFTIFFLKIHILILLSDFPIVAIVLIIGACISIYYYFLFIVSSVINGFYHFNYLNINNSLIFIIFFSIPVLLTL